MTQAEWPERLAQVIAGQVRRYRSARGLSAQRLADRCAELGMEITRSTLADLENGRRVNVTMAQVLVIAAALEVPPLLLVVPVGHVERTEILPHMNAPTYEAARWWRGEGHALKDVGEGPVLITDPTQKNAADLVFQHQDLVVRWNVASRSAADAAFVQSRTAPGQARDQWGEVSGSATRSAMQIERDLAELRKTMRAAGLVPPTLPSALDHLDSRHLLE